MDNTTLELESKITKSVCSEMSLDSILSESSPDAFRITEEDKEWLNCDN